MTTPSVFDVEAWAEPATKHDLGQTAKFLLGTVEPDAAPGRAGLIANLLALRDYTRAELLLAMQRVPFDERASHIYGRGLNVADVERVVKEHRKLRTMLTRQLTDFQLRRLCDEFPTELHPDHFGICGYDADDRPLYVYAKPGQRPKERAWGSDFGAAADALGTKPEPARLPRNDGGGGPSPFGRVEG